MQQSQYDVLTVDGDEERSRQELEVTKQPLGIQA